MPDVLINMSKSDPIFFKATANDACPCGSFKKFENCHGR
jgi:uncharacterized protein YecA (UPF0149 family)